MTKGLPSAPRVAPGCAGDHAAEAFSRSVTRHLDESLQLLPISLCRRLEAARMAAVDRKAADLRASKTCCHFKPSHIH